MVRDEDVLYKKRGRERVCGKLQVGRVVVKGVRLSAHLLYEEASPLGILLSHLLHLHSLSKLPTKTQVSLQREQGTPLVIMSTLGSVAFLAKSLVIIIIRQQG